MTKRAAAALAALLLAASAAGAETPLAPGEAATIRTAITEGRLVQARAMLERNREAAVGGLEQELLEGELMLALRQPGPARRIFRALAGSAPGDVRVWTGAGLAALHLDRTEEALSALEKAVTLPGAGWRSWNALGVACDRAGRWSESERAYVSALQSAPGNAAIWNNRGWSLLLQRRAAEALAAFGKAGALDPGNARIRTNSEIARAMLGDYPIRREAKERAADWAARLNNAGYAAWLSGDLAMARSLLTRAVAARETYYERAASNLRLVEGEGMP